MPSLVVYTVVPGDSLSAIAQKFFGNGNRWPEIYQKNKGVIGPNPDLIYPGQRFAFWVRSTYLIKSQISNLQYPNHEI
jgi:LysM repeat protein